MFHNITTLLVVIYMVHKSCTHKRKKDAELNLVKILATKQTTYEKNVKNNQMATKEIRCYHKA